MEPKNWETTGLAVQFTKFVICTRWVVSICSAVPLFEKQSWHQITHFVLISVFQQIGSLVWWNVGHSAGVDGVALFFCTLRIFQKENGNRSQDVFADIFSKRIFISE